MNDFSALSIPEALLRTLTEDMGFKNPTPIQMQAIPLILAGKDILGSAQTGTGKTAAFGIPLVAKLITDPEATALVMTPTRELAEQVLKQLHCMLGKGSRIRTALLIGGDSMFRQLQQLRNRPRLIVGTPGRICDHLNRGSLMLQKTKFLVLDETDRMLDMGFTIQIEKVVRHLPRQRQTLLFSATLPRNIVQISDKYLIDPVRVCVGSPTAPAENIKQEVLYVSEKEKYDQLLNQLSLREGSIIVFVKTKHSADFLSERLLREGHSAAAIHGDLRQNKRGRVIAAFRKQKYRILVATDIAARGLDIPHIEHVINYDLPQCAEDYIHRIGRTARSGAEGSALCLIAPCDRGKWRAIERLLSNKSYSSGGRAGGSFSPAHRRRSSSSDSPRSYSARPQQRFKKREGGSNYEQDSSCKPFQAKRREGSAHEQDSRKPFQFKKHRRVVKKPVDALN